MQKFRIILLLAAMGGVVVIGAFVINKINSNNSIDSSSASVYNIVGLSLVEDEILYSDKVVVDLNSQILSEDIVTTGTLEISYDKNLLNVEDIIMPSNIIAVNQKIDSAEGQITLQIKTNSESGLRDVSNIARIVFSKISTEGKFTSITLKSTSTLGEPNTLDSTDKALSVSF